MTNFKKRLNEYIERDEIYQDYKHGIEPAHNDGCSDFDWFCIEHCQDIENLLNEVEELHNKIDKAIELLENWNCPECDKNTMREIRFSSNKENVLEILKDSDVDESARNN